MLKAGESLLLRGRFPNLSSLPTPAGYHFRPVTGSFKNLTSIDVPISVSTLLSYGPKIMLPSFTLLSQEAQSDEFEEILGVLEAAGYCHERRHRFLRDPLKTAYTAHVGGDQHLRLKDFQILRMALHTDQFLTKHSRNYMVAEGDKGKVVCFVARSQSSSLCDNFLSGGVSSGQYMEFQLPAGDETANLAQVKVRYYAAVASFVESPYC